MKTEKKEAPVIFNSISEVHSFLGLPKPLHPLVSLVDFGAVETYLRKLPPAYIFNFYKISYTRKFQGKMKYGQNYYDFDEGGMIFISPNQLLACIEANSNFKGYTLLLHPDFIRNYPLGKKIQEYGFFLYSVNEALHLSETELQTIVSVFENIEKELTTTIDDMSQDVMVSYIEVLLNYSNRFYKRQFITRMAASNDLLEQMEMLLFNYFNSKASLMQGLPTVQHLAEQLHVSPSYLSDMLRSLTGQNTQQHIHNKLIEKAKEILSTSNVTVAEVAYQLGFEHPQSFNKIFKNKTNVSPLEFRASFN